MALAAEAALTEPAVPQSCNPSLPLVLDAFWAQAGQHGALVSRAPAAQVEEAETEEGEEDEMRAQVGQTAAMPIRNPVLSRRKTAVSRLVCEYATGIDLNTMALYVQQRMLELGIADTAASRGGGAARTTPAPARLLGLTTPLDRVNWLLRDNSGAPLVPSRLQGFQLLAVPQDSSTSALTEQGFVVLGHGVTSLSEVRNLPPPPSADPPRVPAPAAGAGGLGRAQEQRSLDSEPSSEEPAQPLAPVAPVALLRVPDMPTTDAAWWIVQAFECGVEGTTSALRLWDKKLREATIKQLEPKEEGSFRTQFLKRC